MRKHLGIILAIILIFNSMSAFVAMAAPTSPSIVAYSDPLSGSIYIQPTFTKNGKITITVFNDDFSYNANTTGVYDITNFALDRARFLGASSVNQVAMLDNIKQYNTSALTQTFTYTSNSAKRGKFAVYAANDAGESVFKYFTFVLATDYPALLSNFNGLANVADTELFLSKYEEVFFKNPLFSSLTSSNKTLIATELFNNKTAAAYATPEALIGDYEKNATAFAFYQTADSTAAITFLKNNATILDIATIDPIFASANDTYKSQVASYIKSKGIKSYSGFVTEFKTAAGIYKPVTPSPVTTTSPSGGKNFSASIGAIENTTQTTTPQSIYNDIALDHWAYESVLRLTQRGVIAGDGNKNYRPDDYVTRAEFLKMILVAMELHDTKAISTFKDVFESDWFYSYAASAQVNEIALGDLNGNFNPNTNISRQDAVKIMHNAAMFKNYAIKEIREYVAFADEADIAEYALNPVKAMYCANIINGYEDKSFRPTVSITRAEAAKMIFSFLQAGV